MDFREPPFGGELVLPEFPAVARFNAVTRNDTLSDAPPPHCRPGRVHRTLPDCRPGPASDGCRRGGLSGRFGMSRRRSRPTRRGRDAEPAEGDFHATFSVSLQRSGSPVSGRHPRRRRTSPVRPVFGAHTGCREDDQHGQDLRLHRLFLPGNTPLFNTRLKTDRACWKCCNHDSCPVVCGNVKASSRKLCELLGNF